MTHTSSLILPGEPSTSGSDSRHRQQRDCFNSLLQLHSSMFGHARAMWVSSYSYSSTSSKYASAVTFSSSRLVVRSSLCSLLNQKKEKKIKRYNFWNQKTQTTKTRKCASPQSIFFLPALLFQLQNPLLQPIKNLDRAILHVSQRLTWSPLRTAPLARHTHHAAFLLLIHQTTSVLGRLERKTSTNKWFVLSTLQHWGERVLWDDT